MIPYEDFLTSCQLCDAVILDGQLLAPHIDGTRVYFSWTDEVGRHFEYYVDDTPEVTIEDISNNVIRISNLTDAADDRPDYLPAELRFLRAVHYKDFL